MRLPRLHVASDLHLPGPFEWSEAALAADIILVAGDLANAEFEGLDKLIALNKPVVFVPGNHDFWTTREGWTVADIVASLKAKTAGTSVHVLYNDHVDIQGVRFIGTTLWANFGSETPALMHLAKSRMRDFEFIWEPGPPGEPPQRLQVPTVLQWHAEAVAFLEAALTEAPGPTVVITHMAPSYRSLKGFVSDDVLNPENWKYARRDDTDLLRVAAYASDLEALIRRAAPLLWVHGHIHQRCDYAIGNTRLLCNPRGAYKGPLTERDARAYQLFGYPVTPEMMAASKARFEAYPYWGEAFGFDPNLLVCLEEGVAPVFQAQWAELSLLLTDIEQECEGLYPHLGNREPVLLRSVQEAMAARGARFSELLEPLLKEMAAAWAGSQFRVGPGIAGTLDLLGFPRLSEPHFSFFSCFGTPKQQARQGLQAMRELRRVMPKACEAPAVARRAVLAVVGKMEQVAQRQGAAIIRREALLEPYWREVPFHAGVLYLDCPKDQFDALSAELDRLANPRIPRQFIFQYRHVSEAAAWGDTLP